MPLIVNYKNRIGYYKEAHKIDGVTKNYKIWFCHSNSLCALMHFYDVKKEDGTTDHMVQLHGFFGDLVHARRCIEDCYFEDCHDFHFRTKEMNPNLWKLVKLLVSHGIKVTLE